MDLKVKESAYLCADSSMELLEMDAISLLMIVGVGSGTLGYAESELEVFTASFLERLFAGSVVPVEMRKEADEDNIFWRYVNCGASPTDWIKFILNEWLPLPDRTQLIGMWFASYQLMKIANLPSQFRTGLNQHSPER